MSNQQTRLSVIVLLAVLTILGIYWYAERSLRAVHRAHREAELLHQVERVGLMYDRILAESEVLLGALSEVAEFRGRGQPECDRLLSSVMEHLTYYTALQVIEVDGFVSCGSLAIDDVLFVGDRYYHQAALANRQFTIGRFVVGRLTGKPVVGLAYPLETSDSSEPSGVLALYLDLDEMANRAYELGMPRSATFTLVNRERVVMVRVPARQAGAETVGTSVPASFPAPTATSGASYLASGVDLDGVERLFAVRPLRAGGSRTYGHVYFGVEDDFVFHEEGLASITRLRILTVVGLLLMGGVWLVGLRRSSRKEREPPGS